MLPKLHCKSNDLRHYITWATGTNSQKSMRRNNKKANSPFLSTWLLCRASTYLNSPFAVLPWGLLIPTLDSLGHFVLFFLNTKPGVHRPGIFGATSQRLCLHCNAARSPTVKAYTLGGSLPQQTLHVHCFVITLSSILALLRTTKNAPNMLYPFHKDALLQVSSPTQPLSLHPLNHLFSLLITIVKLAQSSVSSMLIWPPR